MSTHVFALSPPVSASQAVALEAVASVYAALCTTLSIHDISRALQDARV